MCFGVLYRQPVALERSLTREPAVDLALYMPKQGVKEGIFLETSQTEES